MEEEIEYGEGEVSKSGFVMINNIFLNYWSGIIGAGPSVGTLAKDLGITKNGVRKYREVLTKFGMILMILWSFLH